MSSYCKGLRLGDLLGWGRSLTPVGIQQGGTKPEIAATSSRLPASRSLAPPAGAGRLAPHPSRLESTGHPGSSTFSCWGFLRQKRCFPFGVLSSTHKQDLSLQPLALRIRRGLQSSPSPLRGGRANPLVHFTQGCVQRDELLLHVPVLQGLAGAFFSPVSRPPRSAPGRSQPLFPVSGFFLQPRWGARAWLRGP